MKNQRLQFPYSLCHCSRHFLRFLVCHVSLICRFLPSYSSDNRDEASQSAPTEKPTNSPVGFFLSFLPTFSMFRRTPAFAVTLWSGPATSGRNHGGNESRPALLHEKRSFLPAAEQWHRHESGYAAARSVDSLQIPACKSRRFLRH